MSDGFRIGVVIIGSLYWDDNTRARWRQSRLLMARAERAYLPMRHGRLSKSKKRQNTHTMVFSQLCYKHQDLGIGYAVPCSRPVRCWEDLRAEVENLAAAEGLDDGRGGWRNWGAVGLLANPSTSLHKWLLASWQGHFHARTSQSEVFGSHARSERAAVARNGLLRLRWPRLVKGQACDLDLLLATPTAPTLTDGRYPSARAIAEAYSRANLPDYFLNNVQADIRTFQDGAISRWLIKLRPEWSERIRSLFQNES